MTFRDYCSQHYAGRACAVFTMAGVDDSVVGTLAIHNDFMEIVGLTTGSSRAVPMDKVTCIRLLNQDELDEIKKGH